MHTSTRIPPQRRALALLLIALAAGALALGAALAESPEPLLPNTPPDQPGSIPIMAAAGSPDTAAADLALANFLSRPDAPTLAAWGQAIPAAIGPVNLPLIVRQPAATQPTTTPTASPTATATPRPDADPADLAITLWAEPSIRVARGGTLTYAIRVRNYGRGTASGAQIRLPYTGSQITPISSRLDTASGDWVSALSKTELTVTFGELGAGKERSGTITFRVASALADNTVIAMRGSYRWSDARDGGAAATNWAPVLVGAGNDTAAYVWLTVDPASGTAGARRTFYSDRFLPGEGITTWLNIPGGTVRALDLRGTADAMGRVWLSYTPSDLKAGTYQLVAYGNRSRLTGVVSFTVR